MSDFRDDDFAAKGFARSLVRHARADRPSRESYQRARRAITTGAVVGGALGSASVVTATAAAAPKLTILAFTGAAAVKWGAIGVVAGAVTLGAIREVATARPGDRRPVPTAIAERTPKATPRPPAPAAPAPALPPARGEGAGAEGDVAPAFRTAESLPPAPRASRPSPSVRTQAPERNLEDRAPRPSDDLASEVTMLDQVRTLLLSKSSRQALSVIERYRVTWPNGRMRPEATVLQIEALVQSGQRAQATSLAREFLASNPRTPFARRVRALVGLEP